MELSQDVKRLAERIAERRALGDPFLLFLGGGCARAAGVPSLEEMAFKVLADLFERDPSMVADYLPEGASDLLQDRPEDQRDSERVLEAFFELMGDLSGGARYNVLKRLYGPIPVPRFYRDLADLLDDGCFSHVLTTNIDALLEQALNDIGLQAATDYEVISLAGDPSRRRHGPSDPGAEAAITIIKLHGDLAQLQVALSPEEIEAVLKTQRAFVKGELSQDMVLVGYDLESEPVNRWLRWTSGEIWWVNPERPTGEQMEDLEERRPIQYIEGPGARPEEFFGILVTLLQSMVPSLEDWDETLRQVWGTEPVFQIDEPPAGPKRPLLPDELELQYVQDQLQSSQAALARLEREASVKGSSDAALQAQIAYERRQISQLEGQLRELSYSGTRVIELIRRISRSVRRTGGDPGAVSFLTKQANTVKKEYQREEPNQDVVSAAIGASVMLANRLDPELVDRQAVEALGAMAPSALPRGF